ncbi:MAG: hypothetical protein DDT32_02183 [Syntrophomonadaceae bacterium]|nr:hypothetical protein [Bacillota bacterium]MBT9148411.1 hypothetical protein [Bacillota bacterium]
MIYPSDNGRFANLDQWLRLLEAGKQPETYSRRAVVVVPTKEIFECTLTVSTLPPCSPQGYVTAPIGSSLANLVFSKLGRNANVDFESSPQAETLILEPRPLQAVVRQQIRGVRRKLRMLHQPAPKNLLAQGLYFEMVEYELRAATLGTDMTIDWRAPYIDSKLSVLRKYNISCDIDIWDANDQPQQCIEVKSVAGVPTSPFSLSRRELESRHKCKSLGIEYEIVVYGFSNTFINHKKATADVRRVIPIAEVIHEEPDSYKCW